MSFLTILFGLGALGIAFPIVFHLIRRTPRGRQDFSSLMFLDPSPPRLSRRSRLDDLLLLLLRSSVIGLLALAFMRPFLRQTPALDASVVPKQRVAIVVDRSASMRRGDLWKQAIELAEMRLRALTTVDDFAVYVFDDSVQELVGFSTDKAHEPNNMEVAIQQLQEIEPGWGASNLAAALTEVADKRNELSTVAGDAANLQVVLISDMQVGSDLELLQGFEWPQAVQVDVQYVAVTDENNASLQIVQNTETENENQLNLRVTNEETSDRQQFELNWQNALGEKFPLESMYVPAGTRRIQTLTPPDASKQFDRIVLAGDSNAFDNIHYVVPLEVTEFDIVGIELGDASKDAELSFFLSKALQSSATRKIEFHWLKAESNNKSEPFILASGDLFFINGTPSQSELDEITGAVSAGAVAFVLVSNSETDQSRILKFAGVDRINNVAQSDAYRLLVDIAFEHWLFRPFATQQFSDFTNIHFWKTTNATLTKDSQELARFDDGSPALWELTVGKGKIYGLASSWRSEDSQLALSTKFVPFINQLLEAGRKSLRPNTALVVNSPWRLPEIDGNNLASNAIERSILRPDGTVETLAENASEYPNTDTPGIYTFSHGVDERQSFAVNVAPSESQLEPMPQDRLQGLGVVLGTQPTREAQLASLQRLQDAEFEDRQKLWKYLVLAAIVLSLLELIISGIKTRNPMQLANTGVTP